MRTVYPETKSNLLQRAGKQVLAEILMHGMQLFAGMMCGEISHEFGVTCENGVPCFLYLCHAKLVPCKGFCSDTGLNGTRG